MLRYRIGEFLEMSLLMLCRCCQSLDDFDAAVHGVSLLAFYLIQRIQGMLPWNPQPAYDDRPEKGSISVSEGSRAEGSLRVR